MSEVRKRKSPLEIADLILMHNAGASMEMIASVISEWGGLFDDHRYVDRESIDMEHATSQPQSGRLTSEFTQALKQLDKGC